MQLRNRLVMPAMHLGYCEEGRVTDKLINFYRERAKGGVGLIIVGGCKVDEYSGGTPTFINISEDKFMEGLRRLTSTVHQYPVKISCQLYHAGRYAHSFLLSGKQPISASAIRSKFTGETPREMTKEEIKQTIENIAKAALRAKNAGFDAVELLGSAGYLINQFLSPLTNKREDEYGGTFENRCKFPKELIKRVKEIVGIDFVVGIRMSGDDFMEGSNTVIENREIARVYEESGIDVINVTGGWHETHVPQISSYVPPGAFVYLAQQIKSRVKIPVVACNRINNVFLAEKILQETEVDLIGMARGLIADPYLPKKAKEKRFHDIKPCIACNQGCFDKVFELQPSSCLVNPLAGKEEKLDISKTNLPKKVVVVGAGPAGCEAARYLAERGHSVLIYEKETKIGGQLNCASSVPGKGEFKSLNNYYTEQFNRLNIKLELNKAASYEEIDKTRPEVVIFATGATPIKPNIKGIENKNVCWAEDILLKKARAGKDVVVIGGGATGCETAVYLSQNPVINDEISLFLLKYKAVTEDHLFEFLKASRKVTIVEILPKVGKDIGKSTRWTVMQELRDKKVEILTKVLIDEITDEGVKISKEGKEIFIAADTVVIACGYQANNSLYLECKDKFKETYIIGDSVKPRKIIDAIFEGWEVAAKV